MATNGDYETCAVCGRTVLRGERLSDYLDDDRRTVGVCALCKPRAEASGWIPAALATEAAQAAPPRRRLGLAGGLRERFERAAAAARPPREPDEDEPAAAPAPDPEPGPPAAEPGPLEAFNASDHTRTVAGLTKSLGEPRVTLRDDLITVAWELSWYQWRVRGVRVSEAAKGTEISELDGPDRAWNASAATDGTLSLA